MVSENRPLSPHLQVYRPQITSILSIIHRLTGVALATGALLFACWILAATYGEDAFASLLDQAVDEELCGGGGRALGHAAAVSPAAPAVQSPVPCRPLVEPASKSCPELGSRVFAGKPMVKKALKLML